MLYRVFRHLLKGEDGWIPEKRGDSLIRSHADNKIPAAWFPLGEDGELTLQVGTKAFAALVEQSWSKNSFHIIDSLKKEIDHKLERHPERSHVLLHYCDYVPGTRITIYFE
jgi:hypothetical protein